MAIYNITTLNEKGELSPIGSSDIGIISQLAFGIPSLYTLLDKADIDAMLSMTAGGDASSLHNHDSRYFTETELTDSTPGTTGADLLSSTPILSGVVPTIQGNFTKIESKINALENLGIEWQDSVSTVSTISPPLTPNQWDRYLIGLQPGLGLASGAWSGHDGEITTWDGSQWIFSVGTTGMFISADDEPTKVYYFNGSLWEEKFFENTTAGGFLSMTAGEVRLTGLNASEIIVGRDLGQEPIAVDTNALGDVLVDSNFGLTYKDDSIADTHISATAQISISKLESGTVAYIIVNDSSGVPSSVQMTGDVGISFAGETTIQPLAIKDSMIDFGSGVNQVNDADLPVTATIAVYAPVDATLKGHLEGIDAQFTAQNYSADITNLTNEDLTFLKLNGSRTMTGNLDMGSNEIQAVTRLRADVIANQNNATVLTMTGTAELLVDRQITMGGGTPSYRITNVADGVAANDLVNVGQIPNLTIGKLNLAGGTMAGILNMGNHKIINVFDGSDTGDAVNFGQLSTVQSALDGAKVNKAGDTMTGSLNMNANKITSLLPGSAATDAVNKQQLDDVASTASGGSALKVDRAGDTMTGALGMSTNKVTDLGNGTAAGDAVNKGQLDTKLNLTGGTMAGVLDMGANLISNIAEPVSASDAATKAYADGIAAGIDLKERVRLATVASLPAYTVSGSGVGKTLTMDAVGVLTIDTVNSVLGDRIMVKNENGAQGSEGASIHHGIYEVTTEGAAGTAAILTRAADFDGDPSGEVSTGSFAFIAEGSQNGNSGWAISTSGTIAIDTTALTFAQFQGLPSYVGQNGISILGNDVSVDLAVDPGLEFSSGQLRVKVKAASGIARDTDGLSVSLGDFSTTDLVEGTNEYYTEAKVSANTDVVANTAKISADGSIGTHIDVDTTTVNPTVNDVLTWDGTNWTPAATASTYSTADFSIDFAAKSTDDLAEGISNQYYSSGLFDTDFAGKTTTNLSEGNNLYYTDARAKTAAIINNTLGTETDQAASVAAMKAYITSAAPIFEEQTFVLTALNISDGYVDLSQVAIPKSEKVWVQGGTMQTRGDDFTISTPAAATRVTFAGALASNLVAGNKLTVNYAYYA